MRVATLYKNQTHPSISFEFFPPRDKKAEAEFTTVVDQLGTLAPDYMSMTFGAGGSTSEGSYQAVKMMQQEKKLPTVAYLAGFGLSSDSITTVRYSEHVAVGSRPALTRTAGSGSGGRAPALECRADQSRQRCDPCEPAVHLRQWRRLAETQPEHVATRRINRHRTTATQPAAAERSAHSGGR